MPRKKKDYLDELYNPSLEPGRRLALALLMYVEYADRANGEEGPALDFEGGVFLSSETIECVNCSKDVDIDRLQTMYCSDYCQQVAGTVRYVRRARAARKESEIAFQIGLGDRLNHLPTGGYPAKSRFLLPEAREAIFERDHHICKICNEKPASQVDHIDGSSNDPSNLQAVCVDCNREKAFSGNRPATSEEQDIIEKLYIDMALRIAAPLPALICDNHEGWQKAEPKIRGARQKLIRKLVAEIKDEDAANWEDVDGYVAHTMAKND